MALVSMKEMLQKARKEHYAVGSYDIFDIGSVEAVIEVAEKQKSPTILMISEGFKKFFNNEIISMVCKKMAAESSVPIALLLDHGQSYEYCITALRNGFSSIMIDASKYPLEQNIMITKKVVGACKHLGISVEGELGHAGTASKLCTADDDSYKTDPEEVKKFVAETEVDALAVSIGNAHGVYNKVPKIDHARLIQLNEASKVPLVLHGGSGISDDDLRLVIKEGICKINVFTEMSLQAIANIKELVNTGEYKMVVNFSTAIKAGVKEVVAKRNEVFGSIGKA
jgi:fructose-bisphosphate aldolase class II